MSFLTESKNIICGFIEAFEGGILGVPFNDPCGYFKNIVVNNVPIQCCREGFNLKCYFIKRDARITKGPAVN